MDQIYHALEYLLFGISLCNSGLSLGIWNISWYEVWC